jgi:hypothetical protein
MTPGGRIVEVAREQALLLPERTPQFRAEAVKTLMAVIQEQSEGTSQQRRRQRVHKLVSDLGTKALNPGGAE